MPSHRLVLLAFVLVAGCKDKPSNGAPPAASGSSAPSASASIDPDLDEVKPVYPLDVKPDPLAQRICAALHDIPEARKATCCGRTPGFVFMMGECVRNLSAALQGKAVTLATADADACTDAITKQHDGCDWVGPYARPIPAACRGILHGAIAVGQGCRSNLECVGNASCLGVGPTTAGRCSPPRADGAGCGRAVDVLATYTKQDFEETHRECIGSCNKFKCVAELPAVAPAKVGAACPAGVCEGEASCLLGKCVARKATGDACEGDRECVGGCVKGDAGGKGVCGKRCD